MWKGSQMSWTIKIDERKKSTKPKNVLPPGIQWWNLLYETVHGFGQSLGRFSREGFAAVSGGKFKVF